MRGGTPGRFQVLVREIAAERRDPAEARLAVEDGTRIALAEEGPVPVDGPSAAASTSRFGLLRALHEQARIAALSPDDRAAYFASMERFVSEVLAEQNGKVVPGQTPRQLARIARTVAVELEWAGEHHRAITLDLSSGGFRAVLASSPPRDEPVRALLHLGRQERVEASVRVAGVRRQRGSVRVSFAFHGMTEEDRRRLELYVADKLLAHAR